MAEHFRGFFYFNTTRIDRKWGCWLELFMTVISHPKDVHWPCPHRLLPSSSPGPAGGRSIIPYLIFPIVGQNTMTHSCIEMYGEKIDRCLNINLAANKWDNFLPGRGAEALVCPGFIWYPSVFSMVRPSCQQWSGSAIYNLLMQMCRKQGEFLRRIVRQMGDRD